MTDLNKLISKMHVNGLAGVMTVLTPAEALAVHAHITDLQFRNDCLREKQVLTMQNSYDMVQEVVRMRRHLESIGIDPSKFAQPLRFNCK